MARFKVRNVRSASRRRIVGDWLTRVPWQSFMPPTALRLIRKAGAGARSPTFRTMSV